MTDKEGGEIGRGDRKVRDKPRFKLTGINNSDGDLFEIVLATSPQYLPNNTST